MWQTTVGFRFAFVDLQECTCPLRTVLVFYEYIYLLDDSLLPLVEHNMYNGLRSAGAWYCNFIFKRGERVAGTVDWRFFVSPVFRAKNTPRPVGVTCKHYLVIFAQNHARGGDEPYAVFPWDYIMFTLLVERSPVVRGGN